MAKLVTVAKIVLKSSSYNIWLAINRDQSQRHNAPSLLAKLLAKNNIYDDRANNKKANKFFILRRCFCWANWRLRKISAIINRLKSFSKLRYVI